MRADVPSAVLAGALRGAWSSVNEFRGLIDELLGPLERHSEHLADVPQRQSLFMQAACCVAGQGCRFPDLRVGVLPEFAGAGYLVFQIPGHADLDMHGVRAGPGHEADEIADGAVDLAEAPGLGDLIELGHGDFPPLADALADCRVVAHCSHPSSRQARCRWILRTTPGLTSPCRGTDVECRPQGHIHFSCGPSSLIFLHPCLWRARTTRRLLIGSIRIV